MDDLDDDEDEPGVELFLSRGAYRSGDTVCGTVRLFRKKQGRRRNIEESFSSLRTFFTYASVHVSGKCRVDTRWHPARPSVLRELYGSVHPSVSELPSETLQAIANADDDNTTTNHNTAPVVCFFATNCVNLLDLPEYDEEPRPSRKPNITRSDILLEEEDSSSDDNNDHEPHDAVVVVDAAAYAKKCHHLAFTFQVTLPEDLPPTTYATCCRYFYNAVVSVRTIRNQVLTAQLPFALLSCARMRGISPSSMMMAYTSHMTMDQRSKTRVQVGVCSAKAHSQFLSCHVSASTYTRRTQIGVSSTGLCSTMTVRDTRCLRMTNADGIPVCILNAIGSTVMLPGGRLMLQFDFLLLDDDDNNRLLLPCQQIVASLRGEEVACHGKDARVITRTYVFDTSRVPLDSNVETISMTLGLPLDSPCSLSTELVEISIFCRIELTVETAAGRMYVLSMDLPVEVVETKIFLENEENYTGGEVGDRMGDIVDDDSIPQDILNDLTMLSIRMLDAVNLESSLGTE